MKSDDRTRAGLRDALAAVISGEALTRGDAGYDEARAVWNGRFDRSPAVVARCASTADVAASIRFARAHDLPISVKGGGHAYAGNTVGEAGLLIDLGAMRDVVVDVEGRRAHVGGGATWRDVDAATQPYGLATPGGTVSSVGVAGFTLGGGQGWLSRRHGLAADNLLAAEVVTADGTVVRAEEGRNRDLLWALRGGSGNYGVVTRFEFALHQVGPEVLAGQVMYPVERGAEMLRLFRESAADAPDDLGIFVFFLRIPPLEFFPEVWHGRIAVDFVLAWFGPVEDGAAVLAPFREAGDPILDTVAPQPYLALQQSFDAGMAAKGNRWYSRAHYFDDLSDEAIETIVAGLDPLPGEFTTVYLGAEGGAAGRVAPDSTAFPHRRAEFSLHVFPGWVDPAQDGAVMAWARGLSDAVAPHANGGVYVNLLADDEVARVPAAFRGNFERLGALKAKWDPSNVFRMNHNISPGS
ncbi:MAG TPA: FAD-binding oxidoreductase [Longimicrobiales bacterium]|nr:FAD-binding oxidoreductase [Longimicrobiales bacterium]